MSERRLIVKQVTAALSAPLRGINWRFCERYLKRQLDFVIVSFDGVYRCAQCVADYTVLA